MTQTFRDGTLVARSVLLHSSPNTLRGLATVKTRRTERGVGLLTAQEGTKVFNIAMLALHLE